MVKLLNNKKIEIECKDTTKNVPFKGRIKKRTSGDVTFSLYSSFVFRVRLGLHTSRRGVLTGRKNLSFYAL